MKKIGHSVHTHFNRALDRALLAVTGDVPGQPPAEVYDIISGLLWPLSFRPMAK